MGQKATANRHRTPAPANLGVRVFFMLWRLPRRFVALPVPATPGMDVWLRATGVIGEQAFCVATAFFNNMVFCLHHRRHSYRFYANTACQLPVNRWYYWVF